MEYNMCEKCINLYYDEEYEDYLCSIDLDEDELYRLNSFKKQTCPYFRSGDDYTIVKKQN